MRLPCVTRFKSGKKRSGGRGVGVGMGGDVRDTG